MTSAPTRKAGKNCGTPSRQALECLIELPSLEEDSANIAKLRGDLLLAADLLGKGAPFEEADILLNKPSNLSLMKIKLSDSQRHNSIRCEILTARIILEDMVLEDMENSA
ncbi:hypothetical protein V6N13_105456 [Hibiscus sabdariffa]|uniref:Rubisco LSMT substrate-binding domain-containing protein n=1 Tax=Hibiscus sabdariffa TaxID=183260 RepID=A0ABR2EXT7_9ROSI